jgi:DNA-binding transcriptional LysR family regulator
LAGLAHWRDRVSGTVRVTASTYAAQTVLMQKLPRFLLDHPDIKVEINVEDQLTDIVSEGFDAGIRFHMSVDKDMIAIPVGPMLRTVVVGTPAYFERHPPPQTPADLKDQNCVGFRLKSGAVMAWDFEEGGREFRFRPSGQFIANDGPLMAAAVRAGAALGYMMEEEVAEEIADGRLIQVLGGWCVPFPGLHLYHPSRRQQPPALRALIAALRL